MREAIAYATGEMRHPPMALAYAHQMRRFRALPSAGGLRDQPARLMLTIEECFLAWRAFSEVKRVEAGKLTQWIKENPELARVYRKWR